ncbi:MAG TPA: hypothetical protein VIY47_11990 [Ignavibacteriaceae bacterium]
MRLLEIERKLVPCPFYKSIIQEPLYHGTQEKFSKFLRPLHGIYVTPFESWATAHYGTAVILYANVRKLKELSWKDPESDAFYDRDYDSVAKYLQEWSHQGYDCCKFGGESDSMVLFNNIQIVNALTGESM